MIPSLSGITGTFKKKNPRKSQKQIPGHPKTQPIDSITSIYIRVHSNHLVPIPTGLTNPLTTGSTIGPIAGPSAGPITGPSTGVTSLMTSSIPPTIAPTKGPSPLTPGLSILTTEPNIPATNPNIPGIPAISLNTGISSSPQSLHPAHRHLYLIEGTFKDIERYAGTTVDWVIKIAHFICDPSGTSVGRVYTHTTGSISAWLNVDRDSSWREVAQGDTLCPGIYEFSTTGPIVLSKICHHPMHLQTSLDSETQCNASSFCCQLEQRDGNMCVVTQSKHSLTASHLIPKWLGTDGARAVVARFCGEQEAHNIDKFDPKIGILLSRDMDSLVDVFELGFYHSSDTMVSYHIELSIVYI